MAKFKTYLLHLVRGQTARIKASRMVRRDGVIHFLKDEHDGFEVWDRVPERLVEGMQEELQGEGR